MGGKMPYEIVGYGAIAAYLGKDGIAKLLGPTADYLGGELKNFAQKRVENVGLIFKNASKKLKNDRQENGAVSPKVLRSVLNEGSYSSDVFGVEYFGGILASSKTEVGRDDRGARLALIVSSMTSYQLRAHYILYSAIISSFKGSGVLLNTNISGLSTFITMKSFMELMEFNQDEIHQVDSIFSHIFGGLAQDGLINTVYSYGSGKDLKKINPLINESGIVFLPSHGGVELYLWAFGEGGRDINYILNSEFKPSIDGFDIEHLKSRRLQ